MLPLSIYFALVFLYSLFAGRLARTVLTAPLLFAGAGMLTLVLLPDLRDRLSHQDAYLTVAEIGLVLLLFTDASRTDLRLLRSIRNLPARLLGPGLLLTILLGGLAALVVFRQLTLWEAGILGAILAPTDAGLGQIIVKSPLAPERIRQALNVEAGLNDGLSVPFLMFFIALAETGAERHGASLTMFIVQQLGVGAIIGLAIGGAGGVLMAWSRRREWTDRSIEPLGIVALPLLCLLASEATGASMFISAFVAGLAVQRGFKEVGAHSADFSEEWGQLINLFVFFLFGMQVARTWGEFSMAHVAYAALSLTVVRMVPVAIALRGTGLSTPTVLFMGWFGPRGLASIVLGLVYLEHQGGPAYEPAIRPAVMMTVLLSILVHGMSALPGLKLYAASVARLDPDAPERGGIGSHTPAPPPTPHT
jgi:NhaP-type Na+/H+ or K+/H+ antiporter